MASSTDPLSSTSALSFQGLSTGMQTDSLVKAIMEQASVPLQRLQAKQTQNTARTSLLQSISSKLRELSTSIGNLNTSGFTANSVTSSDANNAYVSATGNAAANGNYKVVVNQVARAAQSVLAMPFQSQTTLTLPPTTNPTTPEGLSLNGDPGQGDAYTLTDAAGVTHAITLTAGNNTLAGLADAINNASAGVTASVVPANGGGTQYSLVLKSTALSGDTTKIALTPNSGSTSNKIGAATQVASTANSIALGGTAGTDGYFHYTVTNTSGLSTDIKLAAANNTLSGLRDAVSSSSNTSGVSASLVQVDSAGTQFSFALSALSTGLGASGGSSVSIAAAGSNTGSMIGAVVADPAKVTNKAAENALFTVNGVSLSRTSNTVTDAVQGMTLTLKAGGQTDTTATNLTVGTDKAALTSAMQDVVTKFNAIYKLYKDNSGYDGSGNSKLLANDSTIRGLISQVRSSLMFVPSGLPTDNAYQSAAELGLSTNRDGTLSLNSATLQSAVDKNTSAVANVFGNVGYNLQNLVYSITSYGSGNIAKILQNISNQNENLNLQISQMQTRLDRKQKSLESQYAALETTVGQLQSIGNSLSGLR